MTVSAIVPTWNRADLVQSIVSNLRAQTCPPTQILIIDNGSEDSTQVVARELATDLVVFPENRGFAAAVNAGIQQATGEWLLIVNNDVILEPTWIERLLSTLHREHASFGAGKLLQKGNPAMLDGSWDLVSRAAYAWRCGYNRRDGAIWSVSRKICFAPMTAALFHKNVFEQIGLLETRFESYYEDVDFGVRCALASIEGIYEPAAVAVHLGKATFGNHAPRVMYLSARNQVLLLAKHYPARTLRRFAWPILIGQILSLLAAANHGRFFAALRGKYDALRQWHAFRQPCAWNSAGFASTIESTISESEYEIRNIQRQIGFDIYWRLYFGLVRT